MGTKQAAEVDVLSGGRLRLGVGLGWNPVEYSALNERFENRARRIEEQIKVMRLLWSDSVVNFTGEWHKIEHAGLLPLPVQRPIPIWMGTGTTKTPYPPATALQRIARIADGWFPLFRPYGEGCRVVDQFRAYVEAAGRDPGALGMEGRVVLPNQSPSDWITEAKAWRQLGASHLSVVTGRGGLSSIAEHLQLLEQFSEAAQLLNGIPREI